MQRSVNQFRPKGDPSAPAYAPQRDIANIYLPMLREVFTGLDAANWGPFFRDWFEREGITEDQLGAAVTMMVEAHRLFIRDREVASPSEAFVKAGADVPEVVRQALFCRLGEVVTGGFFVALRDVTMQGQESPCHTDMVEMIAAGRILAARLRGAGSPAHYDSSALEIAKADADEQRRLVAQLQDMLSQQVTQQLQFVLDEHDSDEAAAAAPRLSWLTRIWRCVMQAVQVVKTGRLPHGE